DENYIRESILNPGAKIVSGFKPIMPTFQGQVSEENLMALVAYVKSLAQTQPKGEAGDGSSAPDTSNVQLSIRPQGGTWEPLYRLSSGKITLTPTAASSRGSCAPIIRGSRSCT